MYWEDVKCLKGRLGDQGVGLGFGVGVGGVQEHVKGLGLTILILDSTNLANLVEYS